MAVGKRKYRCKKTGRIIESPFYHYRVQVNGERYSGNTGCTRKTDAEAYETSVVREVLSEKSAKELIEKHRDKLSGGNRFMLADAWDKFRVKPRRRPMGEQREATTKSRWDDFLKFMLEKHPDATRLSDVTRNHAEEYVHHIRTKGRWDKEVVFKRAKKRREIKYQSNLARLSTNTANDFLQTCKMVFKFLADDAGLVENPFAHIDKLAVRIHERDAFTPEELRLIGESADGDLYSVFLTAISTGLSEGDICMLEKSRINLETGWIIIDRKKTGKPLRIPIMPGLRKHLLESVDWDGESQYVYPDLADMYQENRTGISYRVKKFLNDLKIDNLKKADNRDRMVSVKDVHSLRHTFIYLAALNGIPFPIVQSIVGHMSPAMTKRYMDHATDTAKAVEMAKMPQYLAPAVEALPEGATEDDLTPMQKIYALTGQATDDNWREVLRDIAMIARK